MTIEDKYARTLIRTHQQASVRLLRVEAWGSVAIVLPPLPVRRALGWLFRARI